MLIAATSPSIATGALWGALLGVGFIGGSALINGSYEGRKPMVTALFVGYEVIVLIVMGAIIGAIR